MVDPVNSLPSAAESTAIAGSVDIFAIARQQMAEGRKMEKEREEKWMAARRMDITVTVADGMTEDGATDWRDGANANANAHSISAPSESTLIFCGAPNSGKSTLLSRFIGSSQSSAGGGVGQQQQAERSVALEYTFMTRPSGTGRQLVNCWELAGGASMANLLEIPINRQNIGTTSVLLFLDLTRPEQFQSLLEQLLGICRKRVEQLIKTSEEGGGLKQPSAAAVKVQSSEDGRVLRPLGIPLVIVCARYDEFQNVDSERKRLTYRLIRLFALLNGASVISLSSRMDSLIQKARLVVSTLAFGSQGLRTFSTDPLQPLFIFPHDGADSLEKIDPSRDSALRALGSFSEGMFHFLHTLNEAFPQQQSPNEKSTEEEDKSTEGQFAEEAIDTLVEYRMRQLELYASERRNRLEAEQKAEEQQRKEGEKQ